MKKPSLHLIIGTLALSTLIFSCGEKQRGETEMETDTNVSTTTSGMQHDTTTRTPNGSTTGMKHDTNGTSRGTTTGYGEQQSTSGTTSGMTGEGSTSATSGTTSKNNRGKSEKK